MKKVRTSNKIPKIKNMVLYLFRVLVGILESLESYLAIHSEQSKQLSIQITNDIIPNLISYISNEKVFLKEIEIMGKEYEKKLKDVTGTYEKV